MLHLLKIYTFWINVEWKFTTLPEEVLSINISCGWVGRSDILGWRNFPDQRANESEQYLQMYIKFISISYNTARYKDCLSQHCPAHFHSYLLCLHAPLPKSLGTTQEIGYNSITKRTCNLDRKIRILLKKEIRTNETTGRD